MSLQNSAKDPHICVWPNCLQQTDLASTISTFRTLLLKAQSSESVTQTLNSQATPIASQATGHSQANTAIANVNQSTFNPNAITNTNKKRPDSAYRQKKTGNAQSNYGSTAPPNTNIDKHPGHWFSHGSSDKE